MQSPLLGQYYWFCFYFTSLAVDRAISCLFFKLSFTCLSVQQPNEMLRLVRFWGKGTVVRENQENLFQNYSTKWAGVLFGFEKVFVCVGLPLFCKLQLFACVCVLSLILWRTLLNEFWRVGLKTSNFKFSKRFVKTSKVKTSTGN